MSLLCDNAFFVSPLNAEDRENAASVNIYRILGRVLGSLLVQLVFRILIGETVTEGIPAQFPFTLPEILFFPGLVLSMAGRITVPTERLAEPGATRPSIRRSVFS